MKVAMASLMAALILAATARSADVPLRAAGLVHPNLSPDARSAACSYRGAIWRLEIESGVARRLAFGAGYCCEPCWSPDGKRIAYLRGPTWGGGTLHVIDAETGEALPAPADIAAEGKIAFAPDGRLVGSFRKAGQFAGLRTLDLASGALAVAAEKWSPRSPWAIAPDGKRIATVATLDTAVDQTGNFGPMNDVWLAPLAGGAAEKLVRFPARIHAMCFSADGKGLFVETELGGAHNDIHFLSLDDATRSQKLTFGQADEQRPSVSADGSKLLYSDNRHGPGTLMLRNLIDGDERAVTVRKFDWGSPTGRLRLKVIDASTRKPATARLAVRGADGLFHAPPGALWRTGTDHAHFYAAGEVEFELPAGTLEVRAYHGPEFRVARGSVELKGGAVVEHVIELQRWVDPGSRGWWSGDNHIHANYGYGEYFNDVESMLALCAGEALHVCNFVAANSDGDGVYDREYFRGALDPRSTSETLLYWNEEFRSTIWGHMTLVNLSQLVEPIFTGFAFTTNPGDAPTNGDVADAARRQGGLVNYTHPSARLEDLYLGAYTAKGLPVFAAVGKIDSMDVMGTGGAANVALYHRLLNCGIRLAASAGTDVFLNRIRSRLPGAARVYVDCGGPLNYAKWIAGLKAGKSFVTNGPMLSFSVEGVDLGGTVDTKPGAKLRVRATVESQYPLDSVQVFHNGKAVLQRKVAPGELKVEIDEAVTVEAGGWFALQASGPAHREVEAAYLFAHTSPVHVTIAGKAGGSRGDARYFLAWVDRLAADVDARDRVPADLKAGVRVQLDAARVFYRRLADANP